MRLTLDLPLVPATCTQRKLFCGLPSSSHISLMGSKLGSIPNLRACSSTSSASAYSIPPP